MSNPFFEHPILNSPYEYPQQHWELDAQHLPTQRVIDTRRKAEFITPIPKPKKRKAGQRSLSLDEGKGLSTEEQQYDTTSVINEIRFLVDQWRKLPNPSDWGVTPETARLLQHWRHHQFGGVRPFFCQVEAVETAIWLTEVAPKGTKTMRGYAAQVEQASRNAHPDLLRVALKHRVTLPGEPVRPRPEKPVLPEVPWERNRIWIWDATHFTACKRIAYAIVDVVTRYWIGYLLTTEQTHTQAQLLFAQALEDQGLLGEDGLPPDRDGGGSILVAWSDNGPEMTAVDTRQFMALMTIAQHHGRPGTPTDQAHVESFFSHLKGDWPLLTSIRDPDVLDQTLAHVRTQYNTVRLHAAIGYVTPDDEHHGRGPAIRRARIAGMRKPIAQRIEQNRASTK